MNEPDWPIRCPLPHEHSPVKLYSAEHAKKHLGFYHPDVTIDELYAKLTVHFL